MSEVTVKEPKTVTEEVTRYECDNCSYRGTDEEIQYVRIYDDVDSRVGVETVEKGHLCNECLEADEYTTLVELRDDKERLAEMIEWTVTWSSLTTAFVAGVILTLQAQFIWVQYLYPSVLDGDMGDAVFAWFMISILLALLFGIGHAVGDTIND